MTAITVRLEETDKRELEAMCAEMGMSLSTFFMVYAKKALRERRIPFELDAPKDPFYSEANMRALGESEQQYREGRVVTRTLEELEALANA